eukprot:TRINITY_DN11325_c0_g1::TRINITY_DN11325_c0_g1_i1::g.26391::m.26391 TRINITY_DN11325_c0_g1::TRINITY_DN11325_c0_g1_i1::g.26391  ORF type:complete len:507 (+),score=136.45,sp/Q5JKW1/KN14C_ORYSJ/42.89/4e-112,Kinesin/PF00225.18/3.1e+03,Kinesin/PF00225.18/2.3e-108,CorA/PF01544.13/0.12,CorA/PF01544.13/4.8e+02,Coiled-coil_56/PF09813.4/0.23,Coiled-coil_56/PF09813.4/2.5e+03,Filament/PF00038.16/2.3,Filament/PF00038.16/23,DUF1664/PF07889.7/6.1,DUF1664/PF07889.7/52,DUF1664/PF07889.7/25,DUF1664/PF07889.7/5.2e+0
MENAKAQEEGRKLQQQLEQSRAEYEQKIDEMKEHLEASKADSMKNLQECGKLKKEIDHLRNADVEKERALVTQMEKEKQDRARRDKLVFEHAKKLSRDVSMYREALKALRGEVTGMAQTTQNLAHDIMVRNKPAIKKMDLRHVELEEKFKKQYEQCKYLHNLVQELRGNIRVYCRTRPILPEEGPNGAIQHISDTELQITDIQKNSMKQFEFDKVYPDHVSQSDVFEDTRPLVQSVLDGYNVCIFAYGQTGAGKTYTMEGPSNDPGVNVRALTELFDLAQTRTREFGDTIDVSVGMYEIYNETVRDLLTDEPTPAGGLEIKQGKQGMFVANSTVRKVNSHGDILEIMKEGAKNRSVGATKMNEQSSRSHCMLSIFVSCESKVSHTTALGKLHLVDLAGSERVSKSGAMGDRLKEAQNINKSLSALGDVIQALQQKTAHIPFRNSKLTYLLQDSLGGNSKTLMFVQVAPEHSNATETICSLKFAQRARSVELGQAKKVVVKKDGPAK